MQAHYRDKGFLALVDGLKPRYRLSCYKSADSPSERPGNYPWKMHPSVFNPYKLPMLLCLSPCVTVSPSLYIFYIILCLSVSACHPICLSVCRLSLYLFLIPVCSCLSVFHFLTLFARQSVCPSVRPFVCLFVCLSLRPPETKQSLDVLSSGA